MRFFSKPREIEIFGDVPFLPRELVTPGKLAGRGSGGRPSVTTQTGNVALHSGEGQ
jgi:hypothetical protein